MTLSVTVLARKAGTARFDIHQLTARASAMMEQNLDAPPADPAHRHDWLASAHDRWSYSSERRLGTTPKSYFLSLRLTEALPPRHRHDQSLYMNIALATGFASQSSFARAFRSAFGPNRAQPRRQN